MRKEVKIMAGTKVNQVMEIRGFNSRTGEQLSALVANILGIGLWIIETKRRVHPVLQIWSKLMIPTMKDIFFGFHLASAEMRGFLTLVVLTT